MPAKRRDGRQTHHDPAPSHQQGSGRKIDRRDFLALAGLGAAGLGLAACSSTAKPKPHPRSGFPLGAAARASSRPVPISMWHSMTSANLAALTALTRHFNGAQGDVHVSLFNQNTYAGTLSAYARAVSSGSLPDLVQMDSTYLQILMDSATVEPVQSAIEAEGYDLSDFLTAATESFRVSGALWAMPFNCATQLLFYDKSAFRKAGLDADAPPRTLSELHAAAEATVRTGTERHGLSLELSSSSLDQWMALGGETVVNHANGRLGRATGVTIDTSLGSSVFEWWSGIFKGNLAQSSASGSSDNLLAIANRLAPMTLDSSSSLAFITEVLKAGHYTDVDLAVAPTPSPLSSAAAGGGPVATGGGLHLVKRSSDERLDGAWQFAKFLVEASSQADWAALTGSVPVRRSAAHATAVLRTWEAVPGYRIAYEQLLASPGSPAASTPVIGAAPAVAKTVQRSLGAMAAGAAPAEEVSRTVSVCNEAIAAYNKHASSAPFAGAT